MRFNLVDQIVELIPGKRILAVKNLTLGEEYLADHFPTFPVMPGVLMLEALVQAGAWLIRVTDDFAHSLIVLKEVKGIKFGSFVEPGRRLQLSVEVDKPQDGGGCFALKGKGEVNGQGAVSGRIILECADSSMKTVDEQLTAHYRSLYAILSSRRDAAATTVS